MRGFPHSYRPTGWFQFGWSAEYAPGEVKALRYFDRDLVAYRGASGELRMFDAFCPHLGAHLGHGGWVEGDDISCPFHGWRFGGDGNNVAIPYSERMTTSRLTLRRWEVREQAGVVLAWHDVNGEPPSWEPPRLLTLDESAYYPGHPDGARSWPLRAHPQVVTENGVDSAHFAVLHKAKENPRIASFQAVDHMFLVDQRMLFGAGKASTWLTPDGAVEASLLAESYGVGLNIARFTGTDEAVSLIAVTPVDGEISEFRMTNWVPRGDEGTGDDLPEAAQRRVEEQFKQAQRDFTVWENMRYVERPPLAPEESAAFHAIRTWAAQFYPENLDHGTDTTDATAGSARA